MGTTESLSGLSFQLFFGISAMVLLTVFIVVFFIIYQRRFWKIQLQAQRMEVAYQKELLDAGILAQEAERERIAIELHDSVGGLLSAAKKLYL
jgi:signal transduction histidine kinase